MMDLRAQQNGFLALAEERGIGVIARTPLCFGFLSGAIDADTRFPEGDHRNGWSRAQVDALDRRRDSPCTMPSGSLKDKRRAQSRAALLPVLSGCRQSSFLAS